MSTVSRSTFYDIFLDALLSGRAAIFAGAGLSAPAGYVNWKDLLRPLAIDIELDIDREHDLLRVAQYAINQAGGRARVNAQLIEKFDQLAAPTRNHEILARLPVDAYWTTNYDSLIEDSLRAARKTPAVKHTQLQLASQSASSNVVVYKMHGDKTQPDQAVLASEDYERYNDTRIQFTELLRGSLTERTFLFLGFSFSDPNIDHVLSRVSARFGSNRREHFWITRRAQQRDFPNAGDLDYARRQEDLRVRDLQRYGIQTIFIDGYGELTIILEELTTLYRRRFVFISGAAHDFEPLGQSNLESLARGLGGRLANAELTLISGGGLGIGTAAVLGAIVRTKARRFSIQERVQVTSFDQAIEDATIRNRLYQEYREEMIGSSGFSVFISGNKAEGTGAIKALGVQREFDTAVQARSIPIPIGATGWVAEQLWHRVRQDPVQYYGDDRSVGFLDQLAPGCTDIEAMIRAVMNIIHTYDGRRRYNS